MQKMPKIKIAITGTIGSGKTAFCEALRKLGHKVFVSDEYNAELLKIGSESYYDIIDNFDVLDENKNIDKKKLAAIVFNNPNKLKLLESFTTLKVVEKIKTLLIEDDIQFFEIPLLFELNLEDLFDKVIVITADSDLRIQRLIKRGISKEDAEKRINNQFNDDKKIANADIVIYNNSEKALLFEKAIEILKEI